MKTVTLCLLLFIFRSVASGQNLIGYNHLEIIKFMKENHKEMNYNTVKNSMFSYLKYSDNYDRQTILFFLAPDSVCTSVRVICDSTMRPEKIKELDAAYRKLDKDSWIDDHDGKQYLIRFRTDKWTCSITIEPEK
jgi:hypothetical protein